MANSVDPGQTPHSTLGDYGNIFKYFRHTSYDCFPQVLITVISTSICDYQIFG